METITIIAIIALLIPSTAFMFIVVKQIKQQTNRDKIRNSNELKKDRQSYFLPHRVEAHQRVVLFLERISPNSLKTNPLHEKAIKTKTKGGQTFCSLGPKQNSIA